MLTKLPSKFTKVKNHLRRVGFYRTRTIVKKLRYRHLDRHAVGPAFGLIRINPNAVEEYLSPRFGPHSYVFDIKGGDWDKTRPKPIEEYDMYRAFENHFTRSVPWEETEFYQRILDQIESGKTKWGCRSAEEFQQVCQEFDALHESILEHGFLSMEELHERGLASDRPVHANEVCVAIGRDGTLYSDEGRHRLFIAKALGLEEIPVRVLVRHRTWQQIRDQTMLQGTPPDKYETHSDLP